MTTLFTLEGHHLGDGFFMPGETHWACLFVELAVAHPATQKGVAGCSGLPWSLKNGLHPLLSGQYWEETWAAVLELALGPLLPPFPKQLFFPTVEKGKACMSEA